MLREYQKKLLIDLVQEFKSHRKILIQAPTGAGKSEIIKTICQKLSKMRIKVLTHRKELKRDLQSRSSLIDVEMIETFKRNSKLTDFDMLIVDECHISNFDPVVKEFCGYVVGFTATPIRSGNQVSLDTIYDSMISSCSTQELIEQGYLVPTINYTYESVDWSKFKKSQGDFDLTEQSIQFEQKKVYKGVISNYTRLVPNSKAMVFTSNIQSSTDLASHLQEAGLPAYCVHSRMNKQEREAIVNQFIASKSDILVNCSILTTGFDCPDIQTVILYRATTSRALYNQMIGRGVRISKDKQHCTVLDFGENIKRFGLWEDDFEYSLKKEEKKSNNQNYEPVKECPQCDRLLKAKDKLCKYCGYQYPAKKEVEVETVELNLVTESKKKIGYYLHRVSTQQEAIKIVTQDFGYKIGWWFVNKKRYPHII